MSSSSAKSTMVAVRQVVRGGPETLRLARIPLPRPAPDELLIRVTRSAVNFADQRWSRTGINHFTGDVDPLPAVPGGEIAGTRCDTSDRVVALCRTGGYAQFAAASRTLVFPLPANVTDETALGVFVPGLTASYLLQVADLSEHRGSIVVHGASGAVGGILVQLLRSHGRRVIASASTVASRDAVRRLGATIVVDAAPAGLAERLRSANDGSPVDVILDPIGGPVLEASLAALGAHGRLVTYGNAAAQSAILDPRSLIIGSRTITGFWLMDFLQNRLATEEALAALLTEAGTGRLAAPPARVYPLADAGAAMAACGERGAPGRVLLDPGS